MTQLTIASTRCRIEAETGDFVLASNLDPFLQSDPSPPDLRLILELTAGPPAPRPGPPVQVRVGDGELEFIRPQGTMLARDDFALCHVRMCAQKEAFSGQPWLMLALWGCLAHRDGLLLHGACCELEGSLILLLGERQAGKSTLGRLVVAAGGACLTDEYPLVTRAPAGLIAHGSPWPGIVGQPAALGGPLAAVFYLSHAPANLLTLLPPKVAAQRLITNNRFFTWSPRTLPVAFELIEQISTETPVYDFGFVPELSAVDEIRRVL